VGGLKKLLWLGRLRGKSQGKRQKYKGQSKMRF
jgi:hypothetical protein